LWDPLCGSGSLLLEAHAAINDIPPLVYTAKKNEGDAPYIQGYTTIDDLSSLRKYHFESWPVHDNVGYEEFVEGTCSPWMGDDDDDDQGEAENKEDQLSGAIPVIGA
jgi:23S rRNA G2445 N2-methylase RlmL